jgi:hypothetical protein
MHLRRVQCRVKSEEEWTGGLEFGVWSLEFEKWEVGSGK